MREGDGDIVEILIGEEGEVGREGYCWAEEVGEALLGLQTEGRIRVLRRFQGTLDLSDSVHLLSTRDTLRCSDNSRILAYDRIEQFCQAARLVRKSRRLHVLVKAIIPFYQDS